MDRARPRLIVENTDNVYPALYLQEIYVSLVYSNIILQTQGAQDLRSTILIASMSGVASIAIISFVIVVVVFELKNRPQAPERGQIELNPIYGDYFNGEPEYSTVEDNNDYYEVTG